MAKKIVIIGAGPGGYVCAIRAAQLGNQVTLIDKNSNPGGTCLNRGCIPSKNLLHVSHEYFKANTEFSKFGLNVNGIDVDYKTLQSQKNKVVSELGNGILYLLKKNGVRFVEGAAKIIKQNVVQVGKENLEADAIVIATGSEPRGLNSAEIDEEIIVSSTGALNFETAPKTMAVIGGGYIGLELGSVWQRFGTKVTVIEAFDRITPGLDKEVGNALFQNLSKQGINFELSTQVLKVNKTKNGAEIHLQNAEGKKTLNVDKVLVSIGRIPNAQNLGIENVGIKTDAKGYIEVDANYTTSCASIYAIGDVIPGPMLAHKAEEEGYALAEHLSGMSPHIDYNVIPAVVYTQPEVASVGFTEQELEAVNIPYKSSKFPFTANSRAKAVHDTVGFVKLLSHSESGLLLGAHIIGSLAGTLIAELALALSKRIKVEDVAKVCHAHPTHSEAIKEAALIGFSKAIHV
jgi:dihydrolipoamide dehydrogenase